LTDDAAQGIPATDAPALCFQYVHAQQPPRLRAGTENTPIRRNRLIPHTFTRSNQ
jgi:hypothetical protein